MEYQAEREQIAYFMRRLYRQQLTTTSGGNVSCRIANGDIVAITASKLDKCELGADGVGLVTMDGASLTPELTLSIETGMHQAIYRARPDVMAIVHAHPVTATAFCAVKKTLDTRLTAEAYAILGNPAFAPYALMGTAQLAENVAASLGSASCILLENHGVLTVGNTILQAFDRLELLEIAARQTLLVEQIGTPSPLTEKQLEELDRFAGR